MRIVFFLLTLTLAASFASRDVLAAFPSFGPDESESESSEAEVIKETKSKSCQGLGALICAITELFNDFFPGSLSFADAPLSLLFSIQKSALSGTNASDFEGSITKLLPPGYQTEDRDPRAALILTENQSVPGEVLLNRPGAGTKEVSGGGTYAVEAGARRIPATFDEIAPLRDKFGFLRQMLDPSTLVGNFKFSLPNVNFGPRNDPGKIDLDETSKFDVQWNAGERTQTVSTSPDPNDPDCQNPPAQGGDGTCTRTGSGELGVSAKLDTATKVLPASQAGDNLLVVASLFLPPGAKFKGGDVAEELTYEVKYKGETSQAKVPLKVLGGAVNAYRCVTEQLFLLPGSGATGPCEKAINSPSALGESTVTSQLINQSLPEAETKYQPNFWATFGQIIGKFLGQIISL